MTVCNPEGLDWCLQCYFLVKDNLLQIFHTDKTVGNAYVLLRPKRYVRIPFICARWKIPQADAKTMRSLAVLFGFYATVIEITPPYNPVIDSIKGFWRDSLTHSVIILASKWPFWVLQTRFSHPAAACQTFPVHRKSHLPWAVLIHLSFLSVQGFPHFSTPIIPLFTITP